MAEQWRVVGMAAAEALIMATIVPEGSLGPYLSNASAELARRRVRMGNLASRGHAIAWREISLDGPAAMLGEAAREFARYNDIHSRFVRVFSIYGRLLGVLEDGPLWRRDLTPLPAADLAWRSWVESRARAYDRIDLASQSLRAVAVYDLATVNAFTVARTFPERSPDWTAWMRAAHRLAVRAQVEAAAALLSELGMYRAVASECYHALEILGR